MMRVRSRFRRFLWPVSIVLAGACVLLFSSGRMLDDPGTGTVEARTVKNGEYNLASVSILSQVINHVSDSYYDQSRVNPGRMFRSGLEELQRIVPEVVVGFDEAGKKVTVTVNDQGAVFDLGGIDNLWSLTFRISEIFRFVQTNLINPIDPKLIEYGTINGMLKTLDPHSIVMDPEEFTELDMSTKGNFGGLGLMVGLRDGRLTVIHAVEDTPAFRAGLKSDDVIVKIGDLSTVNMDLMEAVSLMRGEPGTVCSLSISREGVPGVRVYDLVRAVIDIRSISSRRLKGGIGYIKAKNFQGNTYTDLRAAIESLAKPGQLRGLVLDLRSNPGGLLSAAEKMADKFLDDGVIVSTVGPNNSQKSVTRAGRLFSLTDVPMAVLVSPSSASASEIVAGALKNNDRAVVIGQRTFGKGSVQMLYKFDDGSALKLTIAQYLTPGDVSIQSVGIVPDIELVPVRLEQATIVFDNSAEKRRREQDLEEHLVSDRVEAVRAAESVRYLWDQKRDEIDPDDSSRNDYFLEDFTIRTAVRLLQAAPAGNRTGRTGLLAAGKAELERIREREDGLIAARFGEMGVVWTAGPVDPAAAAIKVETACAPDPVLHAGRDQTISVTVRNTGKAPLYRLRAVSTSDYFLLNGLEFVFGELPPGASRSWSRTLNVPDDVIDRTDRIGLSFVAMEQPLPQSTATEVTLRGWPRPRLAHTFSLSDEGAGGITDGRIQAGDRVAFSIHIENRGDGPLKEPIALLKNADSNENLFIEQGRVPFAPLSPGERATAAFVFTLKPGAAAGPFTLQVMLFDEKLMYTSEDELELSVTVEAAGGGPAPAAGAGLALPAGTLLFGWPELREDGANSLGTLGEAACLPVGGVAGEWRRVELPEGASKVAAWVKAPAVDGCLPGATVAWERRYAFVPPRIALQPDVPGRPGPDGRIPVSGTIEAERPLLDMYVVVNDMKVFYRSFNRSGVRAWEFDLPVQLKRGLNTIQVVARQDPDFGNRLFRVVTWPGEEQAVR